MNRKLGLFFSVSLFSYSLIANSAIDPASLIKSKDGIYILPYVIKEADMGQKKRDTWLQNLQKSKINQGK